MATDEHTETRAAAVRTLVLYPTNALVEDRIDSAPSGRALVEGGAAGRPAVVRSLHERHDGSKDPPRVRLHTGGRG